MRKVVLFCLIFCGLYSSVNALEVPNNLIDILRTWLGKPVSEIPQEAVRLNFNLYRVIISSTNNEKVTLSLEVKTNTIVGASYTFMGSRSQLITVQNRLYDLVRPYGDPTASDNEWYFWVIRGGIIISINQIGFVENNIFGISFGLNKQ